MRQLFEDALADEPSRDVPVHEDVARGRRRRRHVRRVRTSGFGAVAAVAVAIVLVPASPLTLVDREVTGGVPLDGVRSGSAEEPAEPEGRPDVHPDVQGDQVKSDMWTAISAALPPDVGIADDWFVPHMGPEPRIFVRLERGGVEFVVDALLQNGREDFDSYRPCSDPMPGAAAGAVTPCDERRDQQGRWQVVTGSNEAGRSPDRTIVVEDTSASAAVRWETSGVTLTGSEAAAVADALWRVGARHQGAALASGIDMDQLVATWPDRMAVVERALGLGELTRTNGAATPSVEPLPGSTPTSADTGWFVTSYEAPGGAEVRLAVWQKGRSYEPVCVPALDVCSGPGGQRPHFAPRVGSPWTGAVSEARLGPRGGLLISVDGGETIGDRADVAASYFVGSVPYLAAE